MAEKMFGVGCVGAGNMGRRHLENAADIPWFEIRAVADKDEARAAEQARKLGIPVCATDHKEIVTRDDIDVVFVCVPTAFHAEVVVDAVQHGKHVLCEKPLALTLADGERMIRAAEDAGVVLAVNFQHRHRELAQGLRRLFLEEGVGRPIYYSVHSAAEVRPNLAMHEETLNAGPVMDILCHFVDLLRFVLDSEPREVYARTATLARGKAHVASVTRLAVDTCAVTVTFDSGDVGSFHLSWGLPEGTPPFNTQYAVAPEARVAFEGFSKLTIWRNGGRIEVMEEKAPPLLKLQMRSFAEALRNRGLPTTSGEDGLIALKVSLAALESGRTGQVVPITP